MENVIYKSCGRKLEFYPLLDRKNKTPNEFLRFI